MSMLSEEQQRRAVEVMREYIAAPANAEGKTPAEVQTEHDQNRARLIDSNLKPLLHRYLSGQTLLNEFKSLTDGINKRNNLWGFKGIKGQMFFNMVVNTARSRL